MGALCSSGDTNSQINNYLSKQESLEDNIVKLLLLGPGATGKSTLFKSVQILHSGTIKQSEKELIVQIIRENVATGIKTLITESNMLYQLDNEKYAKCQLIMTQNDTELIKADELITKYQDKTEFAANSDEDIDYTELFELGKAIRLFWDLESIKETFIQHGNNFAFSDNLDYFFDNVENIMKEDYMPSDQDCLKNRVQTTGMNEYEYDSGKQGAKKFKIVDVGGQRSERKKWMAHFHDLSAVIFVASLIDYNTVLYEDSTQNGMKEAVNLFEEVTGIDVFSKSDIILILNKDDLLQKLLLQTPNNGLRLCFSKEGEWFKEDEYWDTTIDDDFANQTIDFEQFHDTVIDFILKLFESRNQIEKSELYHHVTIATDSKIVEKVFNDIQASVVGRALVTSGLAA